MADIEKVAIAQLHLEELAAKPTTPSAGVRNVYFKTDGKFYNQDSTGTETEIGSGSGEGSANFTETTQDMTLCVGYYLPLTGTVDASGVTVIGTGTLFTSEISPGDYVGFVGGGDLEIGMVNFITDDTHLQLYVALNDVYDDSAPAVFKHGNDANDGSSPDPEHALATIQAAVDKVPELIKHVVTILVMPGDYESESVVIQGRLISQGSFILAGFIEGASCDVGSITVSDVIGGSDSAVAVGNFRVVQNCYISNSHGVRLGNLMLTRYYNSSAAISFSDSTGYIEMCQISDHPEMIQVNGNSVVEVRACDITVESGEVGLQARFGGVITDGGYNTITNNGGTAYEIQNGMIYPYMVLSTLNQSAQPSSTDIPSGGSVIWTDTDDSKCYLCYNHGGVVKKVELT